MEDKKKIARIWVKKREGMKGREGKEEDKERFMIITRVAEIKLRRGRKKIKKRVRKSIQNRGLI